MTRIALLIVLLISFYSVNSQTLTPKVDRVLHDQPVSHYDFNSDETLYALGSPGGLVTVQDVETGKVIASRKFNAQILGIFYQHESNNVLVWTINQDEVIGTAYSVESAGPTDNIPMSYVSANLWMPEENKVEPVMPALLVENNKQYSVSQSPNGQHAMFITNNNKAELFSTQSWSLVKTWKDNSLVGGGFDQQNNVRLLFKSQQLSELVYDIAEDELVRSPEIIGENLLRLYPNGALVDIQGVWTYSDWEAGEQLTLDIGLVWKNSGKTGAPTPPAHINIIEKDQSSGKWIVGGGGDTYMSGVPGRLPDVVTNVFFFEYDPVSQKLFDIAQNISPFLDRQLVLATPPENGQCVIVDEQGVQQLISIRENSVEQIFNRASFDHTGLGINADFSEILYTIIRDKTYRMHAAEVVRIENIVDHPVRYCEIGDNNHQGIGYTFGFEGKTEELLWNTSGLPDISGYFLDLEELEISKNGRTKVYSNSIISNYFVMYDTVEVDNVQQEADGSWTFEWEEKRVYIPKDKTTGLIGTQQWVQPSDSYIIILDEQDPAHPLMLFTDIYSAQVDVSPDGRFVFISTTSTWQDQAGLTALFDLNERKWAQSLGSDQFPIDHIRFDEDSPYCSLRNASGAWALYHLDSGQFSESQIQPDSPAVLGIDQKNQLIWTIQSSNMVKVYDFQWNELNKMYLDCTSPLDEISISEEGRHLLFESHTNGKSIFYAVELGPKPTLKKLREWDYPAGMFNDNLYGYVKPIHWHKNGQLAFLFDGMGSLQLWDLDKNEVILYLELYPNGEWLCYNPQGYFDASKEARNYLYYVSGDEPILYYQIKEKYWVPGLLHETINGGSDNYVYTEDIPLYPEIGELSISEEGMLSVELQKRNGGIGKVAFFINGKEVNTDVNPNRDASVRWDLMAYESYLYQEGVNRISIEAYNQEGWMASRRKTIFVETHLAGERSGSTRPKFGRTLQRQTKSLEKPALFGLYVGTSKYRNPKLNLTFADKDAKALSGAFKAIGTDLFDWDRSQLYTFSSTGEVGTQVTNKANVQSAFQDIASKAKPSDLVVLFFSGHGKTLEDDFYYLLAGAGNVDLDNDQSGRKSHTISSTEINQALKDMAAEKQILILDACHSGQIAEVFQEGSKANSTSQEKALEDLQDKTGVYVLASSESNQKSYETEILSQGFLTFSLLDGMSGSYLDENEEIINVLDLFSYSTQTVEELSVQILGTRQKPVMTVSRDVNTFPIGIKNDELKIELPKGKWPMGRPSLVKYGVWNDAINLTGETLKEIQSRGTINARKKYFFTKNAALDEIIRISGVYADKGGEYEVTWNILKNEEPWVKDLKVSGPKDKPNQLAAKIVNITEQKLDQQSR